jgi:hypothetical protein
MGDRHPGASPIAWPSLDSLTVRRIPGVLGWSGAGVRLMNWWLASTGVDCASVRADPTTEPLSIPRHPPVDTVGRARKGLGQYGNGEAEGKEASERTCC